MVCPNGNTILTIMNSINWEDENNDKAIIILCKFLDKK